VRRDGENDVTRSGVKAAEGVEAVSRNIVTGIAAGDGLMAAEDEKVADLEAEVAVEVEVKVGLVGMVTEVEVLVACDGRRSLKAAERYG